ncbi:MAG: alanine racemase [Albidovulum sp.]|nr:alanine racemase [Albidovulum sp.]MDE0532170.1 alanine racemase [Albidovulum sp.]
MPNLECYFEFEPSATTVESLETPIPVIDLDVVERNLGRWQSRCDEAEIANRPHVKTHKLVALARAQIDLGATGVTVQKLGEAEIMAKAGIDDLLLTYNVVGRRKLERLIKFPAAVSIKTVADSEIVVEGLAEAGSSVGRELEILVECDTGGGRNGVQSPDAAVELAKFIDRISGVAYRGLMTFPAVGGRKRSGEFLSEAKELAEKIGLETTCVSTGGTPDMWRKDGLEAVTEYRAGTYIFNDRSQIQPGLCQIEDCALFVLATVVSRPTRDRAIIDAGSKSLTSDLMGCSGFGFDLNSGSVLSSLSEEHGILDTRFVGGSPHIGEQVRILPNHVCPVVNLFDRVVISRGEDVLGFAAVDARGLVH